MFTALCAPIPVTEVCALTVAESGCCWFTFAFFPMLKLDTTNDIAVPTVLADVTSPCHSLTSAAEVLSEMRGFTQPWNSVLGRLVS